MADFWMAAAGTEYAKAGGREEADKRSAYSVRFIRAIVPSIRRTTYSVIIVSHSSSLR